MAFHRGSMVHRRAHPAHVGMILAISRSKHRALATVRWSNGWRETLPVHELEAEPTRAEMLRNEEDLMRAALRRGIREGRF